MAETQEPNPEFPVEWFSTWMRNTVIISLHYSNNPQQRYCGIPDEDLPMLEAIARGIIQRAHGNRGKTDLDFKQVFTATLRDCLDRMDFTPEEP